MKNCYNSFHQVEFIVIELNDACSISVLEYIRRSHKLPYFSHHVNGIVLQMLSKASGIIIFIIIIIIEHHHTSSLLSL